MPALLILCESLTLRISRCNPSRSFYLVSGKESPRALHPRSAPGAGILRKHENSGQAGRACWRGQKRQWTCFLWLTGLIALSEYLNRKVCPDQRSRRFPIYNHTATNAALCSLSASPSLSAKTRQKNNSSTHPCYDIGLCGRRHYCSTGERLMRRPSSTGRRYDRQRATDTTLR